MYRGPAGGGRGRGGGSGPSPALLTANVKNSKSFEELFRHVRAHVKLLNHISLSACWTTLGNMAAASATPSWYLEHAAVLELLVQQTQSVVSTSSEVRARELANIAHGVAKSGRGGAMGGLFAALAAALASRWEECNAQELANAAWAFAKAEQGTPEVYAALARAAREPRRLSSFKEQELASLVWAFATLAGPTLDGAADRELLQALAATVQRRLAGFSVQGLSNVCWGFARLGFHDPGLFQAVAAATQQRLAEFNATDIAQTTAAFAAAGHCPRELFTALAAATVGKLDGFNAQGLANTAHAFAAAGHAEPALYTALARVVQQRVSQFNAHDIANTSWAFAKACQVDEPLLATLASAAERCIDTFNTQDLINTAWAFARLNQTQHTALFVAMARAISTASLDALSVTHIANVAWSFSKAELLDARLSIALARSVQQRVGDMSSSDLSNIAWALANARSLDPQLFAALAARAEQMLDEFADEALDNAEYAFTQAGPACAKVVKLLRLRRRRAADGVGGAGEAVDVSQCGRIVVAGGGIAGAGLAVALQNKGFDVLVLEADSSLDARKQGYGLTIQRQDALQAMGINLAQDDAPSTSHYTFAADGRILSFFGEAFGSKARREVENSGRFIHIPRQRLRSRLVDAVKPGVIRWGSRLKTFTPRSDGGGVRVTLMDGTVLDAALLVGCDGIFSTVRRQLALPGDRLNYVGLMVVLGIVHGKTTAGPWTKRRIFETVDGTTRIYAMPFTTTSTMWQLSFPLAEDAARALEKDPAALKADIMRRCADWHAPVPELLGSTPLDCMSGYPVYDRELLEPEALRAAAQRLAGEAGAVTLIGDAAHPMTPFRAQGANQALSDAVLLADRLAEGVRQSGPQAGLHAALPAFERKMLSRSARVVVASREKARELHSSFALQPARKVQRDGKQGVDMARVIEALRARGVGAQSATDPRGLDAVVTAAMERFQRASPSSEPAAAPSQWGFPWRRALRTELQRAADGGLRRKHLRQALTKRFLLHLAQQEDAGAAGDARWWAEHPAELKALFKEHLRLARAKGRLRTAGKLVLCA